MTRKRISQPRFWQRRFYDFNVWSLKKRVEKLHYMHMNPLKRKLVNHPKEWPRVWALLGARVNNRAVFPSTPIPNKH